MILDEIRLLTGPISISCIFWANDDAVKLAQGLRAALNETNSQKPQVK
jgi:hypothetical protein